MSFFKDLVRTVLSTPHYECKYCGYSSFSANHLRMRKCPKKPWYATLFGGDCCEPK